jgi:elongin-A
MGQLKKAKETNVSKVMDLRALPKVPRDPWMMANNGGVPIGKRTGLFKKEGPSSLVWSSGSRTKLTNGQSVLTRARREAKEISQRSKLAKPTHELKAQAGQVRKAPAGMVNEYKKASEPPIRILTRKKPLAKFPSAVRGPSLEERESRLSAIQAGISQKKSTAAAGETLIGSSDEDELDTDIMFNKTSIQHSRPTPFSSSSHPSASSPNTSAIQSKPLGSPGSSSSRPTAEQAASHSSKRTISPLFGAAKPSSHTSPGTSSAKLIHRAASSPPVSTGSAARGSSPSTGQGERRQAPGSGRKRTEVDIFNRGPAKKPRMR